MSDSEVAAEVKALIRFYERRGKNWLSAAEFTLARHSGRLSLRRCFHICGQCTLQKRRAAAH